MPVLGKCRYRASEGRRKHPVIGYVSETVTQIGVARRSEAGVPPYVAYGAGVTVSLRSERSGIGTATATATVN